LRAADFFEDVDSRHVGKLEIKQDRFWCLGPYDRQRFDAGFDMGDLIRFIPEKLDIAFCQQRGVFHEQNIALLLRRHVPVSPPEPIRLARP